MYQGWAGGLHSVGRYSVTDDYNISYLILLCFLNDEVYSLAFLDMWIMAGCRKGLPTN